MATYTDIYKNLGVKLIVNQTSQNITNNTSIVSWYLYAYKISSHNPWNNFGETPFKATINGTVVYNSNASYDLRGSTTQQLISSGTSTITHTADGTKSIAVEGYANYTSTGYGYGAVTAKGSLSLTSIPRVSVATLSTASFNFGQSVTLTTNRSSSSFTHSVFYVIGTTEYSLATSVGASTSITIPNSRMSSYPSSTSASMKIRTKTYNGTTLLGHRDTDVTVNVPASIIPTIGTLTPVETVAAANIFNNNDTQYIRGLSKLKATAGTVAGNSGSTISRYYFRISGPDGVVPGTDVNTTSSTYTYGTFNFPSKAQSSVVYTVQCRVLDSRNRYSAWRSSTAIRVHYYQAPTINLTNVVRTGSGNTSITGGRTYNVQSLKESGQTERNTGTFVVKYREKGNSTWIAATGGATGLSLSNSSATFVTGAPVNKFYEIQATVTDKIGSAFSSIISVSSEFVTMEILRGSSVGIGIAPPSGTRDLYVGSKGMLNYGDTTSRGNFVSEGPFQVNSTTKLLGTTDVNGRTNFIRDGMYNQLGMGGYYGASSTNTGAITLTMPSNHNGMFSATINIRSYSYSAVLEVSGYTYTSSTAWHSTNMVGNIVGGDVNVRFRSNGASARYITIGELTTAWGGYLQVTVENVKSGHGGAFPGTIGVSLRTTWPGNATNSTFYLRKLFNTANDGSGSSLDADLLDGLHASDFLRSSVVSSGYYTNTAIGYFNLSGGRILYGTATATGNATSTFNSLGNTVTFPLAFNTDTKFPIAVTYAVTSNVTALENRMITVNIRNVSRTGFTWDARDSASGTSPSGGTVYTLRWMAMGTK